MIIIFREFIYDEQGIHTLEVAIVTAILISLAIVFRETVLTYCKSIAEKIIGQ
ncbi:hypothetical protein B5E58_12810 [Tyzzerella sp. An114]|uniref:Flp1 family type IVb pilin n=1 Tax=Tyzzerella sp. An114 TaxID=1965545 RepID=UPI000B4302DB|nr:Flp1 family type IVb pilin [Tyzzerella sp. An114]OUQ55115.1 hypothetical protein B5E58_12810 [Tyzzerella sp. An114]